MSLPIGIYDLFAYTIPGFLYLFVILAYLWKFKFIGDSIFNIIEMPSAVGWLAFVLGLVSAHLLGHLLDYFAHQFVFHLLRRRKDSDRALQEFKQRYPGVDIRFQATDWNLLFTLLRERSKDHSRIIDSFEANSIMLRNVSFGLLWLCILQIYTLIVSFSIVGLILLAGLMAFTFISQQRSRMFHRWFIVEIFEASVIYGNDLHKVINHRNASSIEQKRANKQTRKPENKKR